MAFRAFDIGPMGALQKAFAADLPNLVVVAGPNGAGKSTLLNQLNMRRDLAEPETRVTYLGPHRGWRKTTLSGALLGEIQPHLTHYLENQAIPHWRSFQPPSLQGVGVGQLRDPGGPDEAFSFVKGSLLKLDQRQQLLVRDVWEKQNGVVSPGDVPVLLAPLKALVRSLLPHLDLDRIDSEDESNLRVLFRRVDGQSESHVEIDELSSGEKSVIGLMLPLVEAQVELMLGERQRTEVVPTFLLDEPEIHLHPSLQVLLVEVLNELADNGTLQCIIATQSPTIIDALDDESLFVLAPVATVPDGNQLIPIGRTRPRLEAMRALTGSTHLLTRCRPIVYLEGETPSAKPVSDQRLIEILLPEAKGWVLVSTGGRGAAAKAASDLRAAAAETLAGVAVFALVDRDQGAAQDEDHVISWTVSMIENLLLDPDAIWAILEPHREQVSLNGAHDVQAELTRIAADLIDDEVRLRVSSLQRPVSARVGARSEDEVADALESTRQTINGIIDGLAANDGLADEFRRAREAVDQIVNEGRQLDAFRGKEILNAFFEEHVKAVIPGRKAFEYLLAREVVRLPRLAKLVTEPVRRIERFVPRKLLEALDAAGGAIGEGEIGEQVQHLLGALRQARDEWDANGDVTADLEHLRAETVRITGLLPDGVEGKAEILIGAAHLGARSARLP
jgi:ABC-type ATPase involved in cell division